ncbi:MAG: ferredoxin family protein [Veillonella sp.]|uniref:ferredoxin family protein n=1 Tax=Veillonella sp. TaxID=1926307 RepID=UPI0025CBBFA1|nr:ferredoxin family protein [Veillonella sp.]MBS4913224.1 ferredoxin family protein [Veillonella sp.]
MSNLEEKLGVNKYYVNEGHPHIEIIHDYPDMKEKMKLVNACPVGLYTLNDDGTLAFDYAGCVECGTCRVLCGHTIVTKWEYPDDTKGIEFRQG